MIPIYNAIVWQPHINPSRILFLNAHPITLYIRIWPDFGKLYTLNISSSSKPVIAVSTESV